MLKKIIISLCFILLSISLYFYLHSKNEPQPPSKVVEVELLKPSSIQKNVSLIGTIHPKHASLLVAKRTGVLDILLTSGQAVKKGELLAKIINPDIEKNYHLSKDAVAIAENQYQRFLNLQNKGFVSLRELEEKKQSLIEAQKDLAKTKIEMKEMRFYAPFDGVIGAFKLREGSQLNVGDAVVTIYDSHTKTIDLDIPCTYLKYIKPNQAVSVFNHKYQLSHIQEMMDEDTHMCPADIDVSCEHCVMGDSVTVQLILKEKQDVLVIPTQALFLQNGKLFVYKVLDNHIELVAVKQGIQDKEKVEIVSGLKAGDSVVSNNPERLYPGMEVTIFQPENKKTS